MDKRERDVWNQVRQKTADIQVPEKLEPDNIRRMLEEKEREKKRERKIRWGSRQTSALIAACMVVVIGAAAWRSSGHEGMTDSSPGNWASGVDIREEIEIDESRMIAQAKSYDQVYGYLEEYQDRQRKLERSYEADTGETGVAELFDAGDMNGAAMTKEIAVEENAAADSASMTAAQGADSAGTGEYSETNVRQEGVDEGDIVKTDGTYLYLLEEGEEEIAVVDTGKQGMKKAASIRVGGNCAIREFYVVPDLKKLVAVCSRESSDLMYMEDSSYMGAGDSSAVVAVTYNIEDPTKPVEEGRVSQSGSYNSSRMSDGYLYLFSEYHIWNEVSQHEPREFVPLIDGNIMNADDIYLPQISQANMYEVITAVDLEKPQKTKDSKAILSKGGNLYVSGSNIYFYEESWGRSDCITTIRKVAYEDGELEAKAQGQFDGYLNDSFSIDEYKGNLRVVATLYSGGGEERNSVYVLDEKLKQIGAIEDLAEDERVYSARFMGDVGYFVTFKETDPLFSVDLSNPKKPKIVGELKIPGFSEYLHFYGEDRLLGIGMDVDEETLITDGVKLTMFDISDKTDVKEENTHILENVYSTDVSYDYKAALISPDRNIIGFSGNTEGGQKYFLFEYNGDEGFVCNMEERINGSGMRNASGVYIDDTLYVVQGNIIEAYSLKDYKKVDDLIL